MKKTIFLLFMSVWIGASAQNSKTTVGVMAFQSSSAQYKDRAAQLQEIVMEALSSKSNIEALDRSKDALLNKELDLQIDERSIASKTLVEQGRKLGANQLIIGTLTNIDVVQGKTPSVPVLGGKGLAMSGSSTNYTAKISFSLQIIDVETGSIISHKAFNLSGMALPGMGGTKDDAIVGAMKSSKKDILLWLNDTYPSTVTIVKVEEKTKSGKPKSILVTGVDESYRVGKKVLLMETELIPSGSTAPPLKRVKTIATLTVDERQGDFTICKINDGEDTIEEHIGKAGTLTIKDK